MIKRAKRLSEHAKLTKPLHRGLHRLLVSKMYPYDDLDFQTNFTDKTADDKDKKYEGSLSYALMMKHKLLHPTSSGSYSFTPSLVRSQMKLQKIIDKEMEDIGAQKVSMPCLSPKSLWQTSGRWSVMSSELFKLDDRVGASYCLSPTHEEVITSMVAAESPVSYRRLPLKLYQIGRKFRDEKRPKHGLLRGREFVMKDLYTFDSSLDGAQNTFQEVCTAYHNIINWLDVPFVSVEASTGAMGGSKSMEFHLVSNIGEDTLHTCTKCGKSYNKELLEEKNSIKCRDHMTQCNGIEVAHAFILETKYSDAFKAKFINASGNKQSLVMGCYGIGVGRLLAASVEQLSTTSCLRFPRLLAPHQVCIVPQKEGYKSEETNRLANELYDRLTDLSNLSNEVVIDDRTNFSIGQRVRQASAIGYPFVVVVGKKALEEEPLYELIDVYKGETSHMNLQNLTIFISTFPSIQL